MSVEPIGLVILLLGILILKRGPLFGIYAFIPSTLMGACAALILSGTTIQPAHLLMGFMAMAVLSRPGTWSHISSRLTFPREGFWFIATASIGVVGAYLFPRIFAGSTYVAAVGSAASGAFMVQVPLGPTSGNFTQTVYFIGDLICFLTCYIVARTREGFEAATKAFLLYCGMNILFALLDIATYQTNTSFLLDFMRNSTYAMLDDDIVNGMKRIVGSFTEASSFSYATTGASAFAFRLWLGGVRPTLTLSLALINMTLLILSTSTTAYVALPVLLAYMYATTLWRAMRSSALPRSVFAFLAFAPLLLVVGVAIVLLTPSWSATVYQMINDMIFNKATSDSGVERGSWNRSAINTFFVTYGLGAGIGTLRASSFPLAVISNLGAAGTITYGLFILITLFKRAPQALDWDVHEVRAAARTACIALMIPASLSGALIDLGLPFSILAALACAANEVEPVERPEETFEIIPHAIHPGLSQLSS